MMTLTGCLGVGKTKTIVIEPPRPAVSNSFLECLQDEFNRRVYGPCTVDMLKDWMTRTAPKEVL